MRRKRKHSRRTHKERNNNTKKKYRRKNKTRKLHHMKGGTKQELIDNLLTYRQNAINTALAISGATDDSYYTVSFQNEATSPSEKKNETDYSILVIDSQKQFPREPYDGKFLSHYELMLLENIIDIVHDVVAEGNLSYSAKLSIELIVKSYTELYNYPEATGWRLILLGLLEQDLLDLDKFLSEINKERVKKKEERFDIDFIIQIIKNDSPDNSYLSIFLELFYKWIQPKEKNQAKSTGVSMETAFKKFLYRKNKNKYIINPTYGKKDAIQAEILEDWDYANGDEKQLQVTPYGGGHIRNGIRLWEYVLGRGNSYLDLIADYTWV